MSLAKHFLGLNIQVFCPKRDAKSFRKIVEGVFFKATENYFAGVHFLFIILCLNFSEQNRRDQNRKRYFSRVAHSVLPFLLYMYSNTGMELLHTKRFQLLLAMQVKCTCRQSTRWPHYQSNPLHTDRLPIGRSRGQWFKVWALH